MQDVFNDTHLSGLLLKAALEAKVWQVGLVQRAWLQPTQKAYRRAKEHCLFQLKMCELSGLASPLYCSIDMSLEVLEWTLARICFQHEKQRCEEAYRQFNEFAEWALWWLLKSKLAEQ